MKISRLECIITQSRLRMIRNFDRFCLGKRLYHAKHLRVSNMSPGLVGDTNLFSSEKTVDPNNDGLCKSDTLLMKLNLLQHAAPGTHYILPLLARSVDKLHRIIDQSMQSVGAQKLAMPCLAPASIWKASGRWDVMGSELLTLKDRHGREMCLAPTHEEAVTSIVARYSPIAAQKLPIRYYQIGRKFRDEMRPKNGLLRGREFEMKDLYTFDSNLEGARTTYAEVCDAYSELFTRLGLNVLKVEADCGAMGGSQSHEYHLQSDIGEDTLLKCSGCQVVVNKELHDLRPDLVQCVCNTNGKASEWTKIKGIEVAHAFLLGTKYSSLFKSRGYDIEDKVIDLQMGCFGIGVTRLLAAAIEVLSTQEFLRWPQMLAPHQVCIIPNMKGNPESLEQAESLQKDLLKLPNLQNEVLLDDRHKLSIGMRMKISDWYGFPYRIVVGGKVQKTSKFELNEIYTRQTLHLSREEIIEKLSKVETVVI